MKLFDKALSFLIYSNLFIVGCAVAMVNQTTQVLLNRPPNRDFLFFVLFSTVCSYSFHWWLTGQSVIVTSRSEWLKQNRSLHAIMFIIGLAGAGFFYFRLFEFWFWLALSAVLTFFYSAPKISHPWFRALRKVALGKTIFLAVVWTYVTTVLPLILARERWTTDFYLFILSRLFLIYAICILFDCRDREDDKANGIRSLITYMNQRGIYYFYLFSLVLFACSTFCLLAFNYSFLQVGLLLLPGIILAFLFDYSQRNYSDIFYYLVLDGLMALPAFIILIPGI